jgi:indolepyruvate decarboxylase
MSMGFAVPASIGVAMAAKKLRPYVLVGDGAFQMTGVEISTAVRLRLNPIIIVLNNDGYGTLRKVRDGCFNVITQWNYSKICDVVGAGESVTASTNGEFDDALSRAQNSDRLYLIELKIPRNDASQQLARVAAEVRKMRGSKTGALRDERDSKDKRDSSL